MRLKRPLQRLPSAFASKNPWDPLTPIWKDLRIGPVTLKVDALNDKGEVISQAGTRAFHRAAVFNGPYGKPIVSYHDSARSDERRRGRWLRKRLRCGAIVVQSDG